MWGERSIIGRAIVVHDGPDDLGLGGDQGSITTGKVIIHKSRGGVSLVEQDTIENVSVAYLKLSCFFISIQCNLLVRNWASVDCDRRHLRQV